MNATERSPARARLAWYSHRLLAMSPVEIALHARRKWRQLVDAEYQPWAGAVALEPDCSFPSLPSAGSAPAALRDALQRDAEEILAGRWKGFGHLDLQVDDPPRWHKDYYAGVDLPTRASAFTLNYRALPGGADIKLIWELSRWYQLVRLAMASYVLGHEGAAAKCLQWLDDWATHNPPFRGWNWISALETGMRLVQFTWIDALLASSDTRAASGESETARVDARGRLAALRGRILAPHAAFTWRHRSFGSSANNHLLGELTGLILATVRWPALAAHGPSLEELQRHWQAEVLSQFASDGGNREQALNYQLFSWELSWQAWAALAAAGRTVASEVEDRLRQAARFYVAVQEPRDPWEYGDTDGAFVTSFFADQTRAVQEWHRWLVDPDRSPAIHYWQGAARSELHLGRSDPGCGGWGWHTYDESGYALWRNSEWTLRWDVSPLGYLTTAAHGHVDALHLSIWLRGTAIIVDPGTGCYFADDRLRQWLASRAAHNGPNPPVLRRCPRRAGPFLWTDHHPKPTIENHGTDGLRASLRLPCGTVQRSVRITGGGLCCDVLDAMAPEAAEDFHVRWQFAPGTRLEPLAERAFRVTRRGVSATLVISEDWTEVCPVLEPPRRPLAGPIADELEAEVGGLTSPAFRRVEWAPYVKLLARPRNPGCVFRTTYVASTPQ